MRRLCKSIIHNNADINSKCHKFWWLRKLMNIVEHIMAWKQCSSATSLNIHWPINNFSQSLAWNCWIGGVMTLCVSLSEQNQNKYNDYLTYPVEWDPPQSYFKRYPSIPLFFCIIFYSQDFHKFELCVWFFFIIIFIIIMVRLFFERLCCWWCCFQFLSSESHCFAYRISNNI